MSADVIVSGAHLAPPCRRRSCDGCVMSRWALLVLAVVASALLFVAGCDDGGQGGHGPSMREIPTPGGLWGDSVIVPSACPAYEWAEFDPDTGELVATGHPVSDDCAAALEAETRWLTEQFSGGGPR